MIELSEVAIFFQYKYNNLFDHPLGVESISTCCNLIYMAQQLFMEFFEQSYQTIIIEELVVKLEKNHP